MVPILIALAVAAVAFGRSINQYPVIPGTSGALTGPLLTQRNAINSAPQPGLRDNNNSFVASFNPAGATPMNKNNPYRYN